MAPEVDVVFTYRPRVPEPELGPILEPMETSCWNCSGIIDVGRPICRFRALNQMQLEIYVQIRRFLQDFINFLSNIFDTVKMIVTTGVTSAIIYPIFITCMARQSLPSSSRWILGRRIGHISIISSPCQVRPLDLWFRFWSLELQAQLLVMCSMSSRKRIHGSELLLAVAVTSKVFTLSGVGIGQMAVHNWHFLKLDLSFLK